MEADMQFNKVRHANGLHCLTPVHHKAPTPDTLKDWLRALGWAALIALAVVTLHSLLP
jgi:hypothetical protein